ncbi:hypothetical protein ACFC1R_23735 [Kitasatospora sp. NPDC056138]|uniref:hypothetical protein n=1 Tax=Kitasatospora sp. NPDC056138 TaxID=3345724 RepID=UPI0035DA2E1D
MSTAKSSTAARVLLILLMLVGLGLVPRAASAQPADAANDYRGEVLPYFDDGLSVLAFRFRDRLGSSFSENSNVAVALIDPRGLSQKQLDDLVARKPSQADNGPKVGYTTVPTFMMRDYLPDGAHAQLTGDPNNRASELLVISAMSFSASTYRDKGLHSEVFINQQLALLRETYPGVALTMLTEYSERAFCEACDPQVPDSVRAFYSRPYGLTRSQIHQRDAELASAGTKEQREAVQKRFDELEKLTNQNTRLLLSKDISAARASQSRLDQQEAAANTEFSPPCPPGKGSQASAGQRRSGPFALVAAVQEQPCGGRPNGDRSGGLASVLSQPGTAPGGIDFSTLELHYLADPGTGGLRYAFRADTPTKPLDGSTATGLAVSRQSSDAFFVWLELTPDKFWVNLNPNEPDRIVDSALGRTDVGRILLQADLRMKKTIAQLIHPDTTLGADYWKQLSGDCMSFRTWIVPAPASVYDQDDQLYILNAPLHVEMESQYLQLHGSQAAASCPQQPADVRTHNEAVFRSMILPRIEQAVNTAPEYAELRRVYLSRVAAEWYRQLSEKQRTSYGNLIDRGDIGPWTSHSGWRPTDTFQQYVDSYTKGEFNVTHQTVEGHETVTRTYIFGGVDFTGVSFVPTASAQFRTQWAGLTDQVRASLSTPALGGQAGQVWLGGDTLGAEDLANGRSPDGGWLIGRPAAPWIAIAVGIAALVALRLALRRHVRPRP